MQSRTHAYAAPILSALLIAVTTWAEVREVPVGDSPNGGACSVEQMETEMHDGADTNATSADSASVDAAPRWTVSHEHFRGPLDRGVMNAARALLDLPLGSEVVLGIRGMLYGFRLEPHYHPPGYQGGPTGWHKGVTLYQVVSAGKE